MEPVCRQQTTVFSVVTNKHLHFLLHHGKTPDAIWNQLCSSSPKKWAGMVRLEEMKWTTLCHLYFLSPKELQVFYVYNLLKPCDTLHWYYHILIKSVCWGWLERSSHFKQFVLWMQQLSYSRYVTLRQWNISNLELLMYIVWRFPTVLFFDFQLLVTNYREMCHVQKNLSKALVKSLLFQFLILNLCAL